MNFDVVVTARGMGGGAELRPKAPSTVGLRRWDRWTDPGPSVLQTESPGLSGRGASTGWS